MSSEDWKTEKYDAVFSACLQSLERQRRTDSSFTIEDAKGVLSELYVQEGNDWTGRGEVQDIQLGASIAAYERFLSEWASEDEFRS